MKMKYVVNGDKYIPVKEMEGLNLTKLPPMVFTVKLDRNIGLYLEPMFDKFELPSKIYGTALHKADKFLTTFNARDRNLGILLTGEKGSGKTLTVKVLSNKMLEEGCPVILVNQNYIDAGLVDFIYSLGSCVVVFDEIGKIFNMNKYDNNNANHSGLLSLLDGLYGGKRLYLLTENNIDRISSYLLSRPGRVHYHIKHNRLTDEMVTEFCKDKGVPSNVIDEIVSSSSKFKCLSFDIVNSVIEEYKNFNEKIESLVKDMNIEKLNDTIVLRVLSIHSKTKGKLEVTRYSTNPDNEVYLFAKKKNDKNDAPISIYLNNNDIVNIQGNVVEYLVSNDISIVIEYINR